ncbi:MAG: alpha/beta hydrolase [Candidatus Competibacter denitrificans]
MLGYCALFIKISFLRRFLTIFIVIAVMVLGLYIVGDQLSRPVAHAVGIPPPDLQAETVVIPTASEDYVVGWFSRGHLGFGGVLLLHGVRSDRRQMLGRARFLRQKGYSVLLIDLPAHGESSGNRITFGLNESKGVRAALAFLRDQIGPQEKLAVIGVSLGAAAFVLANIQPPPNAVVLESMYPTIRDAVANRLELHAGWLARPFALLLLWQFPLRLGISPSELQPIAILASLHTPILIVAGDRDLHTTLVETKRLFEAAVQPKELWIIDGAAHVDLYKCSPILYQSKISKFLAKHLQNAN